MFVSWLYKHSIFLGDAHSSLYLCFGERGASIFINPKQLYSSLEIYFLRCRALFVFICFFKFGRTTLAIFHNSLFIYVFVRRATRRWLARSPFPIDFRIQQQGVVFFQFAPARESIVCVCKRESWKTPHMCMCAESALHFTARDANAYHIQIKLFH